MKVSPSPCIAATGLEVATSIDLSLVFVCVCVCVRGEREGVLIGQTYMPDPI